MMRLGISLTSSHGVTDPREGARWMIERAAAAERAGLDSLFVGDHHSTYGKRPSAVAIRRDIYVGESSADAETVGRAIVKAGYRGFDPAALVWGSVAEVVEKLRALARLGYTDIIVRHLTDSHPKVLASLSRLAEVRNGLHTA